MPISIKQFAETRSIGTMLDASNGLGKGFDFLRVALALAVVTWHTVPISTGDWNAVTGARFLWLFDYSILLIFFSLSGFLIAGSALRLSLKNFIINRALRIVPALAVEICLSAVLIGCYFTSLSKGQYFSSFQTYHYFTNIIGLINYRLPGVFTANPLPMVNASLWTVPYEIGCYAIMAMLIQFRLLHQPWSLWIIAGAMLAVGVGMFFLGFHEPPAGRVEKVFDGLFYNRGSRLLVAFVVGIAFYIYRYRIPYSRPIFWTIIVYYCILAAIGDRHYPNPPVTLATVIPMVYLMAFLGVTNIRMPAVFYRGDYSYGIYLYGWPIMQVMRALFPRIGAYPWILWLISVPVIVLFSVFSWHVIEKPVLRARKKFSFVARQRLAEALPSPQLSRGEHDRPIIGENAARQALEASAHEQS